MIDRRSTVLALPSAGLSPQLIIALTLVRDANDAAPTCVADADVQALTKLGYLELRAGRCVLTAAGRRLTRGWPSLVGLIAALPARKNGAASGKIACPKPRWHARQLWWNGFLVKKFRVPAPSQELILAAFEEDGWLKRIDDPLPRLRGSDASDRLGEAVRGLNRRQKNPYVLFERDGTGSGVIWDVPVEVRRRLKLA